ncbi:MAG: hypothetical protein H4O13_09780 [Xanthomonadales bacterium]|nr:hypothetical protein [Xanthomonadales bacterium]
MTQNDTESQGDTEGREAAAIAEGRDARGRFAPGNAGRLPGTRTRATKAVEALLQGEAERLTRRAVEKALEGDVQALKLCLERLAPARKPESRTVEIPALAEASSPADQARAIVGAIAAGELPADVGKALLDGIGTVCRIIEVAELEQRIAALEASK